MRAPLSLALAAAGLAAPAPALALGCEDLKTMVALGIPLSIVEETLRASGPPTAEEEQCLAELRAAAVEPARPLGCEDAKYLLASGIAWPVVDERLKAGGPRSADEERCLAELRPGPPPMPVAPPPPALGCADVQRMIADGRGWSAIDDAIRSAGPMSPDDQRCAADLRQADDATHNAGVARQQGRIGVIAGSAGFAAGVGVLAIGRSGPERPGPANTRSMVGGVLLVVSATGVLVGSTRLADAKAWDEAAAAHTVGLIVGPGGVTLAGSF